MEAQEVSTFTPGPWTADGCVVETDHDPDVALTGDKARWVYDPIADEAVQRANARLIAAAPDLLEALMAIVHEVDQGEQLPYIASFILPKARVAIAKAGAS